jgi:FixJ family two-component response regulator
MTTNPAKLCAIGNGRTTREIAETLKLGVATVDTYRTRIKEKMNFKMPPSFSTLRCAGCVSESDSRG